MKEEIKPKEKININMEPMGTMPEVGAMQQMQAFPQMQAMPEHVMPKMPEHMMPQMPENMMPPMPATMPAPAMPTMPTMPTMQMAPQMICCPFLMNMQCPMLYNQSYMGGNNPALGTQYMQQLPQGMSMPQYRGYPAY